MRRDQPVIDVNAQAFCKHVQIGDMTLKIVTLALITLTLCPTWAAAQSEIQRSMDQAKSISAHDRYYDTESCQAGEHARRALNQNTLAQARGVQGLDNQIARIAHDIEWWTAQCEKDLAR